MTKSEIIKEWRKLNPRGYNMPENEVFMVCSDNTIWDNEDILDFFIFRLDSLLDSLKMEERNGKELPLLVENSPEIYGNDRIKAYLKGYNQVVKIINDNVDRLKQ